MPRRYHDALGVTAEALEQEGAFDGFVDVDANFHIDPRLLTTTTAPELASSASRFLEYFDKVVLLLDSSRSVGDFMFRKAQERLQFKELPHLSLGYATGNHAAGTGIGELYARTLTTAAWEIVRAGVKDPRIFELVGLFVDGIGADRISDMVACIIAPDLLAFSARVARNLGVATTTIPSGRDSYSVPYDSVTRQPIILVPSDILRTLPIAQSWDEIDEVRVYDDAIRSVLNEMLGNNWKSALARHTKPELRRILLSDPALLADLLDQYLKKPAHAYDFSGDPEGILSWHEYATTWADKYPLHLPENQPAGPQQLPELVTGICRQFAYLLEHHELRELLFTDEGEPRPARFAHMLFFGLSDCYLQAYRLQIRVANGLSGHVATFSSDAIMSRRVNVYVRPTSNASLKRLYEDKSNSADFPPREATMIFLVIQLGSGAVVESLKDIRDRAIQVRGSAPTLIVVDGRLSRSTVFTDGPDTAIPCQNHERELWYSFKLRCDRGLLDSHHRFTHRDLARAIGVEAQTARFYY